MKIELPDEMTAPAVRRIFATLGGDGDTRFVGGCVRNALLGVPVGDIDIATRLLPDEVMKKLKAAGIKTVPTGIDHGTVTAVADKRGFEITTLRRDVETDGRRAVVAFTEDWAEDARRRDFTMNTLLADLQGNIYDPLGNGVADLEKRKVRFVGDPAERIAEDYLRVLRFFRFHVRYGKGAPDKAALTACAAASRKLKTLSKERVTQEVLKILEVAKCPPVFSLMRASGILKDVIAASYDEKALTALIKKQSAPDLSARLVLLGGNSAAGVKKISAALRLPNRTVTEMDAILAAQKTLRKKDDHAVLLSLYRHGRDATVQAALIQNLPVKFAETAPIPVFPVTGKMLLKQGCQPGPAMGQALKKLEAAWIKSGFTATSPLAAKTSK